MSLFMQHTALKWTFEPTGHLLWLVGRTHRWHHRSNPCFLPCAVHLPRCCLFSCHDWWRLPPLVFLATCLLALLASCGKVCRVYKTGSRREKLSRMSPVLQNPWTSLHLNSSVDTVGSWIFRKLRFIYICFKNRTKLRAYVELTVLTVITLKSSTWTSN